VDTSAFIAFLDQSDSYHLIFKRLFGSPPAPSATCFLTRETVRSLLIGLQIQMRAQLAIEIQLALSSSAPKHALHS
jgi:predicted nucleic acid-binding protein